MLQISHKNKFLIDNSFKYGHVIITVSDRCSMKWILKWVLKNSCCMRVLDFKMLNQFQKKCKICDSLVKCVFIALLKISVMTSQKKRYFLFKQNSLKAATAWDCNLQQCISLSICCRARCALRCISAKILEHVSST